MSDTDLIIGLGISMALMWLWICTLERRIKQLEDKTK